LLLLAFKKSIAGGTVCSFRIYLIILLNFLAWGFVIKNGGGRMKGSINKSLYLLAGIFLFVFFLPSLVSAQINLWSFGTDIAETDGNIEFWQTWDMGEKTFKVHDITYDSDGLHVKAWILEPKGEGPHPVMIWNRYGGARSTTTFMGWWRGGPDPQPNDFQKELFQYAEAGYLVVVSQYREQGKKVEEGGDPSVFPVNPPAFPDSAGGLSEDPFVFTGNDITDHYGGPEVNDVINLLPLIEKMDSSTGNGGIQIDVDFTRLVMVGISRGSYETYIVLRHLAEERYSSLPNVTAAVTKAGYSLLQQLKETWDELNSHHDVLAAKGKTVPQSMRFSAAFHIAGNFDWTYPDDIVDSSAIGSTFFNFFPSDNITDPSNFPVWNDEDLLNDDWPELGTAEPPPFPHPTIYSENYFARSASLWTDFWAGFDIPMLLMHSKGDTAILWSHSQRLYDVATEVGNADLYTLKLLEASNIDDPPCDTAYGGNLINRTYLCEHLFLFHNYGVDMILDWLEDYDGDGVANEIDLCPNDPSDTQDYDSDGIGDACDDDIDGDGLLNSDEVAIYNTSPDNLDTDDDGLDDGIEVVYWGADWDADTDGDLLVNLLDSDSDNDGVNDGVEVNILGTDPALVDSDSNGVSDGDEDSDNDGFTNAEEVQCDSDPGNPSSKCRRGLPFLMLLLD
jgi:hypothetical protein